MGDSSSKFQNEKMAMTEESEGSDKENNIIKMEVTDGNLEMPPMREDDSGSDDIPCEQLDGSSKPCNNDILCEQPDGSSKQCNNDISCEQPDGSGSDGILCEPEDSSKQCNNDISCEQPDGSGSDGISGEQEESSKLCTNEILCEQPDDGLKPSTNDISCEKSDDSSKSCTNDISCEQPDDSSKQSTNDISCEMPDDSSKSCSNDTEKQISDTSQVCANGIQEQNGNNDNSVLSQSGGFEICTNNNVDKDRISDCTGNETGQENIDDSSEVPSDSKVKINDIAVGEQVCPESQQDHLKNQINENFTNGALETEGSLKNSTEENDLQINDISERIESKQLQDDGNLEKTESSQLQNGNSLEKTVDSSQLQTDDSLDNSLDDSTDSGLNVNDSLESCSKEEQLHVDNSAEVGENVSQLQSDGGSEECLNELYIDENCDPVTIETDLINSAQSKSNDKLEVCINNTQVNTGENSELDISNTKLEIDEETELPVDDSLNQSSTDPQSHVNDNLTVGADRDDNDSAGLTVDSGSRSIMTTEQSSQTDEIIEPNKKQPTHQPSKQLTSHHDNSNHDNSNEIKLQKEVSVLQDQLGQSKMLVTSLQDQVGQSNMLMTSLQDQLGQSKILVTSLQEQLSQSKMLVKKLQSALIVQQAQSNHVITGLKQQLQRNQDEMKKQRIKYDRQLGEVISHMLFLEGQLKKSKKQINQVLKEKDDVIIHQKNQISSLTSTNDKLLQAVREIYGRKQGKNGVVHDGKHLDEEPVSSPSVKEKDKVKTQDKSRFSSLKEKLRRHRSSLDLSDADINVKSGLMNSRQYSSQENLLSIGKRNREARAIRDKKCRSIAGYPDGTLADLILEVPDETESRNGNESLENIGPDFEHWKRKYLGTSMSSETVSQSGSTGDIFVNGHSSCSDFDERSTGSLSGSMPILSERDTNANMSPPKERPHSVSSFEQLHVHDDHSPPDKSPASSPTNTSFSEKNPFKNLKTILKRKGSKMKSHKKRTVSLSQPPAVQNQDSMKKHFEKYDMS